MVTRQTKWTRRAILKSGLVSAGLARFGTAVAKRPTQSITDAVRLKLDAIGQAVQSETRAGRATGISICVAEKGFIVWAGGFGFARKEGARPATSHTPFSLASITKTF